MRGRHPELLVPLILLCAAAEGRAQLSAEQYPVARG